MTENIEENNLTGLEIAVIGMAGRFPGASNISEFWENLKNGIETIAFFSHEELQTGADSEKLNQSNYVKAKGTLQGIEYFDADFFGYSPKEAEIMDPQMRIFYECVWHALEDAGYDPGTYEKLMGLYAGARSSFYWEAKTLISGRNRDYGDFSASILNDKDYLSARISYRLNLRGPCYTIQTACSTSLVAIHLACQGLLGAECDMALAGGISLALSQKYGYRYQEGMIFSQDGHCRTFDAGANGTVFGDGVGIVVLKRYEDALRDGDHIYALIKGSACNNDGVDRIGFTAPGIQGQTAVICSALGMAEVDPETIGYIEAHGTGTSLGDPIEIEALTRAFHTPKKNYCGIGSVKTNVGHLNTAAGVTGFIKTVLALKYKLIPPSLHFTRANAKIDFENSPFYVNTGLCEWKNEKYPRRAGVSSFGIGGTNAHVILEEVPPGIQDKEGTRGRAPLLFLLSAKTETALEEMTSNLAQYLKKNPGIDPADVAYTLQVGRKAFNHRRMLVCSSIEEAGQILSDSTPGKIKTFFTKEGEKPVIFMFPGQGSQYVNMGIGLYQAEPVFRQEMDRCFEILRPMMGYDPQETLYPSAGDHRSNRSNRSYISEINQTEIAQPLVFAFEYALAKLLMQWGIDPHALIGHSIGEYTAACLSGVMSLEDALMVVALRGQLMQKMPVGNMLSVAICEEKLQPLLDAYGNENISLAAVNAADNCVVSGTRRAMAAFEKKLKKQGYECRPLHTSHAYHSKIMEPILDAFEKQLQRIRFKLNAPGIPYISNLTGAWITHKETGDPGYWAKHLRQPVRFNDGLTELFTIDNALFVEVGPGRSLGSLVTNHPEKKPQHQVIQLTRHPKEKASDLHFLLSKLGETWLYGGSIDWRGFNNGEKRYRMSLPGYPFAGQRFWIEGNPQDFFKRDREISSLVQWDKKPDTADWFYIPHWTRSGLFPGPGPAAPGQQSPPSPSSPWLVFMDECGLGTRLVKRLIESRQEVVVLKAGAGFAAIDAQKPVYQIHPQHSHDYDALLETLQKKGKLPGRILHLWGVTGKKKNETPLDAAAIERDLDIGFYSLLYLVQAIGKTGMTHNIRAAVVTDHMQAVNSQEVLCPAKSTILGAVKVISREYANINCRAVDVVLPAAGIRENHQLIDALLEELTANSPDRVVAYRGDRRWSQTYESLPLKELPEKESRLKKQGVYLVTGGLGGIGLVLAEYLVKTVQARLILIGRSQFPARDQWQEWLDTHPGKDPTSIKINKIQELENLGGQVLVFSADVTQKEQMQEVIGFSIKQWGQINGVVHAAGVPDKGIIQRRTPGTIEPVLAAKVRGTLVLDEVLQDIGKPLDFIIYCSSLHSIVGTVGQLAYAAANAFLDAYAYYKSLNCPDHTYIVSINWDGWRDIGMAAEALSTSQLQANQGIFPGEGVDVFRRILVSEDRWPQVIVSIRDLPGLFDWYNNILTANQENSPVKHEPAPGRIMPYAPARDEWEQNLVDIWQDHLGIERVGVHDNFFDLGATSLDLVQVNKKIMQKSGRSIPVDTMFEYPSIAALAEYLSETSRQLKEVEIIPKKSEPTGREIAIIGMAGRFPGAKNVKQFWENIKKGIEAIHFFSADELGEAGIDPRLIDNPDFVKAYGVMENTDHFDALFFNYTPVEAGLMDPQMRILHECVWETLEDAGYLPGSHELSIGFYVGASPNFNWEVVSSLSKSNQSAAGWFVKQILSNKDFTSTRISYNLDLNGPSLTIHTACSTSLVAVDLACRALLSGQCGIALAGGATINYPSKTGYSYQEGVIFSPDGHTRAFDEKAKGTIFGEGAGIVTLKLLESAISDGDHIYAVIKGSATNNDGCQKVGYTAPGIKGQSAVIQAACHMAGIEYESIGYIETHGTGTNLGDPVEIKALKNAFNTDKKNFCALGSVKTNVGHLDAAAGIAGLIKSALMLKHQLIPPSLHFECPNPEIDFENSPFYVNTKLTAWKRASYPLRAGVSSFGIGGTNAHVVLEEALLFRRQRTEDRGQSQTRGGVSRPGQSRQYQLILLSARTPSALQIMTQNLAVHLKENPGTDMADAAYTLQVGRKAFEYKKITVCTDANDAVRLLSSTDPNDTPGFLCRDRNNRPVFFLFPGQGSQYVNMARDLYKNHPQFRQEMDRCFEVLKPLMNHDPKEILYPPAGNHRSDRSYKSYIPPINQTEIAQPLLFTIEYTLAKWLMELGIKPSAMMGHSIGEYVAACLAGIFSLQDALTLVVYRGQLMQQLPAGAMLSIKLPAETLTPLLPGNISLAAVNSSSACVVSGPNEAIDAFEQEMKQAGHKIRRLHTSHAFHSAMIDPILEKFEKKVSTITLNPPGLAYISNVTGNWIKGEEAVEPGYWSRHLRSTVQFSRGLEILLKKYDSTFVEVGPGRTLGALVNQHQNKKNEHQVVSLVRHPQESTADDYFLLKAIGELWLYGTEIHWPGLYQAEKRYRIPLPTYPFEGKPCSPDEKQFQKYAEMMFASSPSSSQQVQQEIKQTPAMEPGRYKEEYVAPRSEMEEKMINIWEEVLGFKNIGIYDNFFNLSGDSLTATQLLSRLKDLYGVEIPVKDFFQQPTAAHLAQVVKKSLIEKIKNLSPEEKKKLAAG
ncbi:MAG: SDR family oxidoreductase [Candidatus Aminicenantes bacterium]|jgi:acyl transferase domain-containing protein/acyl carrier protein